MSISMDTFASSGEFQSYDPYKTNPVSAAVFTMQCRSCGFEPSSTVVAPKFCPKCHGQGWERFAKPGSILSNADRY